MTEKSQSEFNLEKSVAGKAGRVAAYVVATPTAVFGPVAAVSLGMTTVLENANWEGFTANLGNLVHSPAVGEAAYQIGVWGFGLGSAAAVIASMGVGVVLLGSYIVEGGLDRDILNVFRGVENRKRNQTIELSDRVKDAHGSLRAAIIRRSVRSRYGNPSFTEQTEEGTLVLTPRGVALLEGDEVTAYGKTGHVPFDPHTIAQDEKVYVAYVGGQQGLGRGYARKTFRLLTADKSKGTIDDTLLRAIDFKYDAPFMRRENVDGKPALVLNEYNTVGSSGGYAAGFEQRALDPETKEFKRCGFRLVGSDTSALTDHSQKKALEEMIGAPVPDGYYP